MGRFDPSTTEEDVSEFLTESGIPVMKCDMLKKPEEWHQKYATFVLSLIMIVKIKYLRMLSAIQDGADIRDWVSLAAFHLRQLCK